MIGLWVALGLGASEPGRVFLHVEGAQTVDLPWDVVDAGWLAVLDLEGAGPRLEERADQLGGKRIGQRRQVRVGERVATLEVRPDRRSTDGEWVASVP